MRGETTEHVPDTEEEFILFAVEQADLMAVVHVIRNSGVLRACMWIYI